MEESPTPSPEIIVRKKNIILDATIFTSLMACPLLVNLRFNHNFAPIGGKSNSLECGSIVHKVLEVYNHNIINGFNRENSIQSGMAAGETYIRGCQHCAGFKDEGKPQCGHKPDEYPGVQNTPIESSSKPSRTGWKWVLDTCQQYFDRWKNDSWTPLECEVVKGEVLYEDEEIRVLWKAKLDLIVDTNQGIYPVDHKTMKQNRDIVSLNNQFKGQCLIAKSRSVIINKIGFQTSLKPEEKFKRVPVSYTADRLMEWQSEILPYYAKLMLMYSESGYWPPNWTHCESKFGLCVFKPVCEADRGMREAELKQGFIIVDKWDIQIEDED